MDKPEVETPFMTMSGTRERHEFLGLVNPKEKDVFALEVVSVQGEDIHFNFIKLDKQK